MKFTGAQLIEAQVAFAKLTSARLPPVAAFRIGSLVRRVAPEMDSAHQARLAIFRRHGTEKNGQVSVLPRPEIENEDERTKDLEVRLAVLQAELQPLFATEIEIEVRPLPLSLLDSLPEITAAEAMALMPFFEEETR